MEVDEMKCPKCESTGDITRCEFCGLCTKCDDLYDGWFRHPHSIDPYFKGTATAGLLIRRIACDECVKEQERWGLRP